MAAGAALVFCSRDYKNIGLNKGSVSTIYESSSTPHMTLMDVLAVLILCVRVKYCYKS